MFMHAETGMTPRERKPSKAYFTLADYITMAMLAALGVAVKAVITPLAQIVTGPLFTRETFMSAPKIPFSTGMPASSRLFFTASP